MTDNRTSQAFLELESYLFQGLPLSQEKAIVSAKSLRSIAAKYKRMERVLQACVEYKMPADHGEGCECFICEALAFDPLLV